MLKRKVDQGMMDPLIGNLRTAYQDYELPVNRVAEDQTLTRAETMPKWTHYKKDFNGTLDHLFYNCNALEVGELLETPQSTQISQDGSIPSTMFPSDHVRIEAIFFLK